MSLRVVLDTNVIVSAVLTPGRIPASLVALAMQGAVTLFISPDILQEYRQVLRRPAFGFEPGAIEVFLSDLEKTATMVYPGKRAASALDEPDNRILGVCGGSQSPLHRYRKQKAFPLLRVCRDKDCEPNGVCRTFY